MPKAKNNSQQTKQLQPPKESSNESNATSGTQTAPEVQPDTLENPFWLMDKALEKKLRNLSKREMRLQQWKSEIEEAGKKMNTDQMNALSKLDEIKLQIAFVEEMQKLNVTQSRQYKKACKNREKLLKAQEKEKARSMASTPQQTEQPQSEKEEPKKPELNGGTALTVQNGGDNVEKAKEVTSADGDLKEEKQNGEVVADEKKGNIEKDAINDNKENIEPCGWGQQVACSGWD